MAHVVDDWPMQTKRLLLAVDRGERIDYLMDNGTWQSADAHEVTPGGAGLVLPNGAWEAICAIATPGVSRQELAHVQEALLIERARVDRVLTAHLPEVPAAPSGDR